MDFYIYFVGIQSKNHEKRRSNKKEYERNDFPAKLVGTQLHGY